MVKAIAARRVSDQSARHEFLPDSADNRHFDENLFGQAKQHVTLRATLVITTRQSSPIALTVIFFVGVICGVLRP